VRKLFEQWAPCDLTADCFRPDIEHLCTGARWLGLDEVLTAMRDYLRAFSDLRIEAEGSSTSAGTRCWCSRGKLGVLCGAVCPSNAKSATCSHCATTRWGAATATGTAPRALETLALAKPSSGNATADDRLPGAPIVARLRYRAIGSQDDSSRRGGEPGPRTCQLSLRPPVGSSAHSLRRTTTCHGSP
jgi:hypothetical protein